MVNRTHLVIWSNHKCRGNNVTLFESEKEAQDFANLVKDGKGRFSIIVCKIIREDGGEVKVEAGS